MKKSVSDGGKKKPRILRTVLIVLLCVVVALVLTVLILGTNLLNRITKTDAADALRATETIDPDPEDEAPDMTPTPTRTPAPEVSSTPVPDVSPTPVPTPIPISEYYEQTVLTEEQLALFDEHNNSADYINVLLIGADRRGSSGGYNSDVMMIATIDKAHSRLKLTSLLRDTLVDIPGVGYGKLNSAASHGGVELLFETIEHNFHIKLKDYVMVDFSAFANIVDYMGGVTLKMTAEEISAANDNIAGLNKQTGVDYLWEGFIFAEPGPVLCTGTQALGYARIRHLDSDFVRTKRQYIVLNTILSKFRKLSVDKQYKLLYKMLLEVETNMDNDTIIECAISSIGMNTGGILNFSVPTTDSYKSGKWEKRSVLFADLPALSLALHDFVFVSDATADEAKLLTPGESLPPRTPTPTELLYPTLEPVGTNEIIIGVPPQDGADVPAATPDGAMDPFSVAP